MQSGQPNGPQWGTFFGASPYTLVLGTRTNLVMAVAVERSLLREDSPLQQRICPYQ